ncbi:MAG TPA: type II secretion system F family protein [Tepidisphaeraceae bacterium]|nr:type II secretion system F family protein [Tepidisphaeraceae bacterium]
MPLGQLILLIALAAALATFGIAQAVIALLHTDRQKLQQRLTSDWHSDVDALLNRSVMVRPELKGIPPLLARYPLVRSLNRRLLQAYPEARLTRFLMLAGLVGIVLLSLVTLAVDSLLIGLIAGVIGAWLPMLVINHKRSHRQRLLAQQLPESLDFLTRVLKAGHSLSTGIQMMGDELPEPIRGEFRRCHDQNSLGQSLEESLREMATRIDSSEFSFFVTAVLIQRQTGGDLSEVLTNIATMVRSRARLQQHVKAITAEGRMTGYILVVFPIVLFLLSYMFNPEYAGVLLTTETGRMLLGLAIAMQAIGFFAIRKVVAVKV